MARAADRGRACGARAGVTIHAVAIGDPTTVGEEKLDQETLRAVAGRERYPVGLRLAPEWRDSPEALRGIPMVTPSGVQLPLGQLAEVSIESGPPMIRSEDAQLSTMSGVATRRTGFGGVNMRPVASSSAVMRPRATI